MFLRESSAQAGCYSHFHISGVEREALLVHCLSGGAAGECLSPMKHLNEKLNLRKTTDSIQENCCYKYFCNALYNKALQNNK